MTFQVIELSSRTVFWEDLGLPSRAKMTSEQIDGLANRWDWEIEPWIKEHIRHHCNGHEAGVWFADRHDAILFKLTWCNRLN